MTKTDLRRGKVKPRSSERACTMSGLLARIWPSNLSDKPREVTKIMPGGVTGSMRAANDSCEPK